MGLRCGAKTLPSKPATLTPVMKKLLFFSATSVWSLTSAVSSAAVVTLDSVSFSSTIGSPVNYPTLQFAKFDTSLGTLTGVSLAWVVNSSVTSATVTNNNVGSVTIDKFAFTRDFTVKDSLDNELFNDLAAKNVTFTAVPLAQGESKTVSNTTFSTFSDSVSITSGLADYAGAGNASVTLNNSLGVTPNVTAGGSQELSWGTNIIGSSSGTLVVSYTYDEIAAVPEPSSTILSGILIGFSLLIRRRRA